jgi:hypothetical protein
VIEPRRPPPLPWSVWIGFDTREAAAFGVTRHTLRERLTLGVPIFGLRLGVLRKQGVYNRPTETRLDEKTGHYVLWDAISDAPMSTEFAISRFLVPHLMTTGFTQRGGFAVFMDCDMLVRANMAELFRFCEQHENRKYAAFCVKHNYQPPEGVKMDGQEQLRYARKNWTSFIVFNCDHPANKALSVELVNKLPGRDLHRLCWLDDDQVCGLDHAWNFLVGHSDPSIDPKVVHFTEGGPWFDNYRDVPFADEWRAALNRWAA